jgi:hypothetical protein
VITKVNSRKHDAAQCGTKRALRWLPACTATSSATYNDKTAKVHGLNTFYKAFQWSSAVIMFAHAGKYLSALQGRVLVGKHALSGQHITHARND